jgi:hypothetical protein
VRKRCSWKAGRVKSGFLLAAWCILAGWMASDVQSQMPNEYEVKAAFVYNFAKFVEWPEAAFPGGSSPIVLCVVGEDPFGGILARTVVGKTVQGRALVVKRLEGGTSFPCHVLFVSSSDSVFLASVLLKARGGSVLTIGEAEGFAQQGGMINFILSENKVRFEINRESAERAGLRISSKLLALAKTVWR